MPQIDQHGATAGKDIVGRDKKVETHYHLSPTPARLLQLMQRLANEIENKQHVRDLIESLQYYHNKPPTDGVDGLEAKLKKGGRAHRITIALRQKELFAKLLARFSLYESAQEIFALCLSKIEHEFNHCILFKLDTTNEEAIDALVTEKLVDPILENIGVGPFVLNPALVMGMVYWLAEQCFVKWHK